MKYDSYKKPFLNDVIFRINFSTILKLSGNSKEAAENFHKVIFDKFPNVNFKLINQYNLNIDFPSGLPKKFSQEGNLSWIFTDNDHFKQVELNANSLILHYKKGAYIDFEYFLEDVLLLLKGLEFYYPLDFKFLGLRYINQITDKSIEEIKESINKEYTYNYIDDLNDDENFIQAITKLDLTKNNYLLIFQYGFFNPKFPDYAYKKDFILDFDCQLLDFSKDIDIKKELTAMNKIIKNKYESSITDKLRKTMMEE